MQYTINQLYNHLYEKVDNIYDIFKNFFGVSHTDLQRPMGEDSMKYCILDYIVPYCGNDASYDNRNYDQEYEISEAVMQGLESMYMRGKVTLYVWWPRVTVTNEYDKSIDIQDLYAKIEIQLNGRIPYENHGFLLNRATYSPEQFESDYLHSHVNSIPKEDFSLFRQPCLGRGPIQETILTLKNEYDEAEWMLFCQELAMYVTVESIEGVPYRRLENVGGSSSLREYVGYSLRNIDNRRFLNLFTKEDFRNFVKYYLENGHLSLNYRNGSFVCGMPYQEYIIDVSNSFIDFYNKFLASTSEDLSSCFSSYFLYTAKMKDGEFRQVKTGNTIPHIYDRYQNQFVLRFKGEEIRTTIDNVSSNSESLPITIINQSTAMYVLKSILRIINFRYTNEYYNKTRGGKDPSSAYKKVIYV